MPVEPERPCLSFPGCGECLAAGFSGRTKNAEGTADMEGKRRGICISLRRWRISFWDLK